MTATVISPLIRTWADVKVRCAGYRQGFVAVFRELEGEILEGEQVTAASFARHLGIARTTFNNWLKEDQQKASRSASGKEYRPLTENQARELTAKCYRALENAHDRITDLYFGYADKAMGYSSWDEYCKAEFHSVWLRLPREKRREQARSMVDLGMSRRAVASALGISSTTIINDLKSRGTKSEQDGCEYVQVAFKIARYDADLVKKIATEDKVPNAEVYRRAVSWYLEQRTV